MLDENLYQNYQRPKKRFDLKEVVGPVLCGLAVVYLLTAALLGLLAR